MSTVREAIERLQRYDLDAHVAMPLWTAVDVLGLAQDRGINLTDQQADEILDYIERHHDAEIGINWDVIDANLDFVEIGEGKGNE